MITLILIIVYINVSVQWIEYNYSHRIAAIPESVQYRALITLWNI